MFNRFNNKIKNNCTTPLSNDTTINIEISNLQRYCMKGMIIYELLNLVVIGNGKINNQLILGLAIYFKSTSLF